MIFVNHRQMEIRIDFFFLFISRGNENSTITLNQKHVPPHNKQNKSSCPSSVKDQ